MMTSLSSITPTENSISNALTCQKCGRHDPSIRQVTYPYVFSLIFLTYRREFSGRWCWKHRTLYMLLAALISGTVGWFGFPMGLIMTPIALFRLARGGLMHKATNLKLQRSLAEEYQQNGLFDGARRCIENGLLFVDDLWSRQELERYYCMPQANLAPSGFSLFRSPVGLFFCALLISFPAGIISSLLDTWIYNAVTGQLSVLAPLFFWLPLSLFFWGVIVILRQLQERVLGEHPYRSSAVILAASVVTGLCAAYAFLEGRAVAILIDLLNNHPVLPSGMALVNMLGAVLTRGGLLAIPHEFSALDYWNSIHHVLLASIPIVFPAALALAAWPYARLEKLLDSIRSRVQPLMESTPPLNVGKLIPFAGLVCMIGLAFLFPQRSLVDFIEAHDHYVNGYTLVNDGKYRQAIAELDRAIELDPGLALAYEERGWSYYKLDEPANAITDYLQAIRLKPDDFDLHYELGMIYYNTDQLEQTRDEMLIAAQLKPEDSYVYLALGYSEYYLGNLDPAETYFLKARELDDQTADIYIGLGDIYGDRGQPDEQIAQYKKATEVEPDYSGGYANLGFAYYDINEMDLAVASLEKAVSLENDYLSARYYLARATVAVGNPDKAVEISRETVKLYPEVAISHASLAHSLASIHQRESALVEIEKAQEYSLSNDRDRALVIRTLQMLGRYDEAEAVTQESILKSKYPANYYLYLSDIYSERQDYEQALSACDLALNAGSTEADVLVQRASVYNDQEKYDLSLELLNQALTLGPDDEAIHFLMSVAYSGKGDEYRAISEAQKTTTLDRYYYSAFLQLASSQLYVGNVEDAVKSASRAAQLSPYSDTPHYLLGMAYRSEGLDRQAALELQKFLKLYEPSPSKEKMKKDAEDVLNSINRTV